MAPPHTAVGIGKAGMAMDHGRALIVLPQGRTAAQQTDRAKHMGLSISGNDLAGWVGNGQTVGDFGQIAADCTPNAFNAWVKPSCKRVPGFKLMRNCRVPQAATCDRRTSARGPG